MEALRERFAAIEGSTPADHWRLRAVKRGLDHAERDLDTAPSYMLANNLNDLSRSLAALERELGMAAAS